MTNETDGWGGTGWGSKVPVTGGTGQLFYLKNPGDQATIRIATEAYKFMSNTATPFAKFGCGVILKSDSADPTAGPRAVIFTASGDVYESIGKIIERMGNPGKYDITLTALKFGSESDWKNAVAEPSSAIDDGMTNAEIDMLSAAQCLTVGQVEATILVVTKGGGKAKAPVDTVDGDPFDPFKAK